jgi:DNA-binding GntR family transcriptional regulator
MVDRQKIMEELKTRIANGTFAPGQRLVESRLGELLGAPRSRIREALRNLEQDGFVKIIPNAGAVVAEFSQREIENLYDLISVLEGLAVRVITPFLTDEQIGVIEALVGKIEGSSTPTSFYHSNMEFHGLLTTLTENDHLMKMMDSLRSRIQCVNLQILLAPGQMATSMKEHRKIFEAMKKRDSVKAEQLMRSHILQAKNHLLKGMNKSL